MPDKLLIEKPEDGVVLLTLNRPEVLNAIDMELARLLSIALVALADDDEARCIVITGSGDRAFCSGMDIHEMRHFDADDMVSAFIARDPVNWQVANHPKPVIAALNGVAFGAGALLAAACDLRVGCPATAFKVTATSYGGANATWTLPNIVGIPKAKEILFTGSPVQGEEALAIGLLNRFVANSETAAAAVAMATDIAKHPTGGVSAVKRLINENQGRSYADAFRAEFGWMGETVLRTAAPGADVFKGYLPKG